jgi:hypothetical protein
MMKRKYCWFVLVVMMLSMPLVAYSQCTDIFKQGVAMMEAKKYKSAISYFQKAKKCDKNLAKQCDEKIYECRRLINPTPKPVKSSVITLDKGTLEFGSEETNAKTVKVTSEIEWECTTDANWCTVTKMDGKVAIACKINQTTDDRKAAIRVDNGKETKSINVVQKGMDAVLRFAPNQSLEFGKEGVEYLEISLECTMSYRVDSKPEWVTVFREDTDMIAVKIAPLKRTDKDREGFFSIISVDGSKKDYVVIKQFKKMSKHVVNDAEGEEQTEPKRGRKTLKNRKNK